MINKRLSHSGEFSDTIFYILSKGWTKSRNEKNFFPSHSNAAEFFILLALSNRRKYIFRMIDVDRPKRLLLLQRDLFLSRGFRKMLSNLVRPRRFIRNSRGIFLRNETSSSRCSELSTFDDDILLMQSSDDNNVEFELNSIHFFAINVRDRSNMSHFIKKTYGPHNDCSVLLTIRSN